MGHLAQYHFGTLGTVLLWDTRQFVSGALDTVDIWALGTL